MMKNDTHHISFFKNVKCQLIGRIMYVLSFVKRDDPQHYYCWMVQNKITEVYKNQKVRFNRLATSNT